MCQLALVHLGDPVLNGIFLSPLLQVDSATNKDGTGFLAINNNKKGNVSNFTLWKTEMSADCITNLGMAIRECISSNHPVMGHVRYASKGIAPTKENSHPFEGERFYLAHNGRLYDKDAVVEWASDDTGTASDSLAFLTRLEREAVTSPKASIVELLNSAMKDYKGKFAFLIYDCRYNKQYAVRGTTADLHISHIGIENSKDVVTPIGFIVNTKKDSLEDALTIAAQIAQIVTGKYIVYDDATILEKDSIYEVQGIDLVKIGELKESSVTYTYKQCTGMATYAGYSRVYPAATNTNDASSNWDIDLHRLMDRVSRFMLDHFLSIPDMDTLFFLFLGIGLADAQRRDLEEFVETVIPKISASKKFRERLEKVMGPAKTVWLLTYKKVRGLEYPWMLNDTKTLNDMYDYIAGINKAMK